MKESTTLRSEGRGKQPVRFLETLALVLVLQVPLSATTIRLENGCTLADAITSANDNSATGLCPAGSGADTIELTADVTLSTADNVTDGDNSLPSVTSEIVVEGNNHTVARDGSDGIDPFRLLHVAAVGELTLRNTTITGGKARELGSASVRGGAIFNLGTLVLEHSSVTGNSTSISGEEEGLGGGLYNSGTATLSNSTISGNIVAGVALGNGGGIYTGTDSVLSVLDSTISGNQAYAFTSPSGRNARAAGGGIAAAEGSDTVLEGTTVTENWVRPRADGAGTASSAFGGGIDNHGSFQATNSTFYRNHLDAQASNGGTAISGYGAGLHNDGSVATTVLTHVTFSDNLIEGTPSVQSGSSLSNRDGSLTVTNSVIADSGLFPCFGPIVDGGHNFNALCFAGRPDVIYLGSLADNGGPTQTCQLGGLSNARNASPGCALDFDQRGISRLGACDSGATEINLCTDDDPYETTDSGHDGSDDTCWGNEHPPGLGGFFGVSHRHCDEDWAWFQPDVGSTYEIKTKVGNGADTVIQLFTDSFLHFGRDCRVEGAVDDNSGLGLSSRLFYTATSDSEVNIRVTEAFDSYNAGSSPPDTVESYSLFVTCVENCDCGLYGEDLHLARDIVATTATYEACSTLSVSIFTIEETADVTFRAGEAVVLQPGVRVRGSLTVEIDPTLRPPP